MQIVPRKPADAILAKPNNAFHRESGHALTIASACSGVTWYYNRYRLSPLEFAYATCGPCELTHAEVDELIDTMRHSTLTREQNRGLFFDTFEEREDAEECLPCADAILDVSELP